MKKIILLTLLILIFTTSCTSPTYEDLDFSCETDDDCAVGYTGFSCCTCPWVYSKKDIDKYGNLRYYGEKVFLGELRYKLSCKNVVCEVCASVEKAVCAENICRAEGPGIVWN